MSSPFSYELDERQIRIVLRDGEMAYDQSAWSRFEQFEKPDMPTRTGSGSRAPKFNLSISRSVIVPAFFLLLIGGLSATLFSFVDFRKKEGADTKTAALPDGAEQPVEAQKKKTIAQQPETAAGNSAQSSPPTAGNTTPASQLAAQQAATPPTKVASPTPPTAATGQKPVETATKPLNQVLSSTAQTGSQAASNAQPLLKKRKPKTVVTEEIPTINATSTNLNLGNTAKEPEIDLDLK